MPMYNFLKVLFLGAAAIVGMIVFLSQFGTRRTVAMIAFAATTFIVLALCASIFGGPRTIGGW